MSEEARNAFPSPDADAQERKSNWISFWQSPWLSHVFLFDGKSMTFRSQPGQLNDKYIREEHEQMLAPSRGGLRRREVVSGNDPQEAPTDHFLRWA
jgi:hypothetical protein